MHGQDQMKDCAIFPSLDCQAVVDDIAIGTAVENVTLQVAEPL